MSTNNQNSMNTKPKSKIIKRVVLGVLALSVILLIIYYFTAVYPGPDDDRVFHKLEYHTVIDQEVENVEFEQSTAEITHDFQGVRGFGKDHVTITCKGVMDGNVPVEGRAVLVFKFAPFDTGWILDYVAEWEINEY